MFSVLGRVYEEPGDWKGNLSMA